MLLKHTFSWMPMVIIAIANGMIREFGYGKFMGELRAHQISSLTGVALFGLYAWALSFVWPLQSSRQAAVMGLIWLVLTVAFEFIFGHYVAKHPWSRLLHDYNAFQGRLWALVLVGVTIAPYVVYRIRS
jgi:hypothetical protein